MKFMTTITLLALLGCADSAPVQEDACDSSYVEPFCGDNLDHTLWCAMNVLGDLGLPGKAWADPYCVEYFKTGTI